MNDATTTSPTPDLYPLDEAARLRRFLMLRLTDEETAIQEFREQGMDWEGIAERLGGTPESCRKKLARAVHRVRIQFEDEAGKLPDSEAASISASHRTEDAPIRCNFCRPRRD